MKRLILPATLLMAFAAAGFAQQPDNQPPSTQPPAPIQRTHAPNPVRETARMTRLLNLTPDQAGKVEPVLADREQKVAAIRNDATLTPDQQMQQIKQAHRAAEMQLRGILTPDQMQQMRAAHHNHEQNAPAPPTA
jgi:protein CpxP